VFEACKYRLIYATSLPRPTDKTFLTSRAVDLNVGGVPTSQENKHNIVLLINLDVFIAQVTRKISASIVLCDASCGKLFENKVTDAEAKISFCSSVLLCVPVSFYAMLVAESYLKTR
jgi:hypothetical protein